jgi:hypothetical protein
MPRNGGGSAALVLIARVRAGEEDAATDAIACCWPAGDSPFARAGGTHLARLQVVRPPRRRRGAARAHVLLAADVDAPLWPWVERLRASAGAELDAVLGHCAFYPGSGEPAAFARFVRANRVPVGFSVIASPGATVADVGAAVSLRDELGAFVQDTQLMDRAGVHAAWREWRGG